MLTGKNLINGEWVASDRKEVSVDLDGLAISQAGPEQVELAAKAVQNSFREYGFLSRKDRSQFLHAIADEIDLKGEEITKTGSRETGLPEARMVGERGRTVGQLRAFADLIMSDDFLDVRIDKALPDRSPLPRPDLRLTHRPIGPVAIFGASNFPLAFSTAGGDTASALAAGCPVIVKGHPAHAGTGELVAQAVHVAMEKCSISSGVFQFLQGIGNELGSSLVLNPAVKAVGFTGSLAGGRALYDLCTARPQPIPFYGELGSINPVFVLPGALEKRAADLGKEWASSLTMGAGQFCTNPGVILAVKSEQLSVLEQSAVTALEGVAEQKMLTDRIHDNYLASVKKTAATLEVSSCRTASGKRSALPAVFKTDAEKWIAEPELREEIFGAAGIIVECHNVDQMLDAAETLEGQLTATLQMEQEDMELAKLLAVVLEEKAGRLICNGFPTGVEVCSAMMHGGPYPASTDVRSTSVGTLAINRFLRPVCYQDFPMELLQPELHD